MKKRSCRKFGTGAGFGFLLGILFTILVMGFVNRIQATVALIAEPTVTAMTQSEFEDWVGTDWVGAPYIVDENGVRSIDWYSMYEQECSYVEYHSSPSWLEVFVTGRCETKYISFEVYYSTCHDHETSNGDIMVPYCW